MLAYFGDLSTIEKYDTFSHEEDRAKAVEGRTGKCQVSLFPKL